MQWVLHLVESLESYGINFFQQNSLTSLSFQVFWNSADVVPEVIHLQLSPREFGRMGVQFLLVAIFQVGIRVLQQWYPGFFFGMSPFNIDGYLFICFLTSDNFSLRDSSAFLMSIGVYRRYTDAQYWRYTDVKST